MDLNILELFSGIGGMHFAFKYSQLNGQVKAAIDINTVANIVYAHNHPETPVLNNNIQKLNVETLDKLKIDTILMSPPCQPHTRVGQKRDIQDTRSDALNHICELLPLAKGLRFILMENVKGFEDSVAHQMYITALENAQFFYREFILTPSQMGVPNTRYRYYCIARRFMDFEFPSGQIHSKLPLSDNVSFQSQPLVSLLEDDSHLHSDMLLKENMLTKRVWLLDIVTSIATNTMCFTKAYTHYCEGTGSVYCPLPLQEMQSTFFKLKQMQGTTSEAGNLLNSLKLRYFTPREVARLMSFPETFAFPEQTTNRQKYRLLGNSVNVRVVGELIKLMCSCSNVLKSVNSQV